jgi:hypothetical protein
LIEKGIEVFNQKNTASAGKVAVINVGSMAIYIIAAYL